MTRSKRMISVSPSHEELLSELAEGGGASRYVERLIEDAERDWRSAHSVLRASGWQPRELAAACDALNGYWQDYGRPAGWAAQELVDYERISSGATKKWEIDAGRWAEIATRIAQDPEEARCLLVLAREFWRGNPRVDRVVMPEVDGG